MERLGIFLSETDLENDLANSALAGALATHYGKSEHSALVSSMQKKKAENMLEFINSNYKNLSILKGSKIAAPLEMIVNTVVGRVRPGDDKTTD